VTRLRKAALASLLGLLLAAPAVADAQDLVATPSAPPTPAPAFVPGSVIVQWAPGADRTEKAAARADADVSFATNLGDPSFQLVEVETARETVGAIAALRSDPAVAVAERDSYSAPTSIPDDPLFGQEWGLQNLGTGVGGFSGAVAGADIDATDAWEHTIGTPTTVVADIDTGYRFDSPDLAPVAWVNPGEIPGNGIDDDGNGLVDDAHGYDFVGASSENPTQDSDPTDDDLISGGHGVHTAGTIGAAGTNGVGITGVAQDARIMPLRVCANLPSLDESRCPVSSIIAAINYAGANGARVANVSLSGTVKSTAELNALAENPETLFVAAAGNDSQSNDTTPHYPCNFEPGSTPIPGAVENVVCVAATNQADQLAGFSDWGADSVDLGAPGTEILSTYPASEDLLAEGFEQDDFATRWTSTGANGGFERTDEAPLTSFGISDSPGAAPVASSGRSSTLSGAVAVAVPAGDGSCRFSGRDFISLDGGSFSLIVFKDGVSTATFQLPDTPGSQMGSFTTVPMTGLAGSGVQVRVRYLAGPSPTASSGAWLDDLDLSCTAPLSTPPSYAYLQGTSMAAPHVSGTAALLFSAQPGASVAAVRHALLAGVDPNSSLAGKAATGGRLDAARALADLDADAPTAPVLSGTDPASPANENEPRLLGSAEAGSTVAIYAGEDCLGEALATVSAGELASGSIAMTVGDDTEATFSARASDPWSDLSACSAPIAYVEDSTAPAPPVLQETDPASPANDNAPRILGYDPEEIETVHFYLGGSCGGATIGGGSAAEFRSLTGVAVTVADDSVSGISARAADAAGNLSDCSEPIAYTEDSTPPAAPVLESTSPPSPAADGSPRILGSAEGGSSVAIYPGGACKGEPVETGTAAKLDSLGIAVSVPAASTSEFSATATDAAHNTSACSASIPYTNTTPSIVGSPVIVVGPPDESMLRTLPPPLALPPPPETSSCTVPKLAGKTLGQAKAALGGADCQVGKVTKPKPRKGQKPVALVVKSTSPAAGSLSFGPVDLTLGPKPKKRRH
jgi:thermitase